MTPVRPNNDYLADAGHFSEIQARQVKALVERTAQQFQNLSSQERAACLTLWTILARSGAPIVLASLRHPDARHIRASLDQLVTAGVVWYDPDLKAILHCPPFSALTTRHQVKAFGWNPAYVTSALDVALSLLLYGPNTWLQVHSAGRASAKELSFRLLMDDQHHLRADPPPESVSWRVWIQSPADYASTPHPEGIHLQAEIFANAEEAEAYLNAHNEPGILYTFDEALRIGEYLINAYKDALSE